MQNVSFIAVALLGTIHILRQYNVGFFLTHPVHYRCKISINTVLNVSETDHLLDPPTQSFADVIYRWFPTKTRNTCCQSSFMFGQHNTLIARMLFSKKKRYIPTPMYLYLDSPHYNPFQCGFKGGEIS